MNIPARRQQNIGERVRFVAATVVEAAVLFLTDGRHFLHAALFGVLATLVMQQFGREVELPELLWLVMAFAGVLYHIDTLREVRRDLAVLADLEHIDPLDVEAAGNHVRREGMRIAAKLFFTVAGLVSMWLPGRNSDTLDALRLVVLGSLVAAVLLLDMDAVLDRRSRRRQVQLAHESQARREARAMTAARAEVEHVHTHAHRHTGV